MCIEEFNNVWIKIFITVVLRSIKIRCSTTGARPEAGGIRVLRYGAPLQVHAPKQVTSEFLAPYPLDDKRLCRSTPEACDERGWSDCGCANMCSCNRRLIKGMVTAVDGMLTNLTDAMQAKGMWDNTLVFFLGDNGAPNSEGGSNGEHKGMKFNHWEGGHRVASFIGGSVNYA